MSGPRVAAACVAFGAVLSAPGWARAQSASPGKQSASTDSVRAPVGDTPWALPGLYRVGVLSGAPRRFSAALTAGYGYTEPIGPDTGPHHRVEGTLALALAPTNWFEAGVRLNGRYDKHPNDARGPDDGAVFDDHVVLRAGARIARDLRLGPEVDVWFPSNRFSFDAKAITPSMRALLSWVPSNSPWLFSFAGGFRLDRSRYSVSHPEELRRGDRTALGLSQFNAVLLGLGGGYRLRRAELLAELTADMLVGSGAPSLMKSPLRAAIVARYHFSMSWSAQLVVEGTASQRPDLAPTAPLVPVEPRFTALAGLNFRLPFEHPHPAQAPAPAPAPAKAPPTAKAPAAQPTTDVPVLIVDDSGVPLPGARVTATGPGGSQLDVQKGGTGGLFVVKKAPVGGQITLNVQAQGFAPMSQQLAVSKKQPAKRSIQMKRALPQGQLRGLVRSFRGKPLKAVIHVLPIDKSVTADDKGFFEIDVPPGSYTVKIKARGYHEQTRHVKVQRDGVTILNADLRRGR